MTDRISNREFSRAMINVLKEMARDRGELRTALREKYPDRDVLSDEALRKRVERYIPKFEDLDLVELRGDKYCWKNDGFKGLDDEAMTLHSRNLIPALRHIAGIRSPRYNTAQQETYVSVEYMEILVSCVNSHLVEYPKIWKLLSDYKLVESKWWRMKDLFKIKVLEKLKNKFKDEPLIDPYKEGRPRSFIGSNIPHVINNCISLDSSPEIDLTSNGKIWHGRTRLARGSHLLNRVREFVNCETNDPDNIEAVRRQYEILPDNSETKQKIDHEIRILILRIEAGEPLYGGCEICVSDQKKTF
ncbi:hypothetical protein ES703_122933 [subsurface metagenome]